MVFFEYREKADFFSYISSLKDVEGATVLTGGLDMSLKNVKKFDNWVRRGYTYYMFIFLL